MGFDRLLVSFRPERIVAETPDLLVVDKPPGMVVHGGDVELQADLVTRLRAHLRSKAGDDYLGVHQRLDTGTSGLLLFTRRREANAAVASALEGRQAQKIYVALVWLGAGARSELRPGKVVSLEHRLVTREGRSRVVARGGDLARARARLLERRGELGLVELELETGRTHQLRVQLAAIGAPVLGDAIYALDASARQAARRLMLHARVLRLPDGQRFEAPLPEEFRRVFEGRAEGELGSDGEIEQALLDAGCLRAPLAGKATAFRLVNDAADGLPGVTIDRYDDWAVLEVASEDAERRAETVAELLIRAGARGVYLKRRKRADLRRADHRELAPEGPFRGEAAPERLVVVEADMRLAVELGSGLGTGLFVDQREARARIRALSGGARVLNLFSYTSSFSVAAALGGAASVVSGDLSRRVLDVARENFRLNGLDPERYEFVQADALAWMKKRASRPGRFTLTILDPPSFSSEGSGKAFNVRQHYGVAAELAIRLLEPGGTLLAVTNHRGTSLGRLRRVVRDACERAGRRVEKLKDEPSPLDCPALATGPHPSKGVLLRVR